MIRRVLASAAVSAAAAGSTFAQQPAYASAFGGPPGATATAPGHAAVSVTAPSVPCPAAPCPTDAACPAPAVPAANAPEPPRFWGAADYLFFFLKGSPVPVPVATTGPAAGRGILDNPVGPGRVVLGNADDDLGLFSGFRLTAGGWLNQDHNLGLEASAFLLENRTERSALAGGPGGLDVLARPFFDTTIQANNTRLLAQPGAFVGGIRTTSEARLWGANLDAVLRLVNEPTWTVDAVTGFRFLSLEESYTIRDTATVLADGITAFNGAGILAGGRTSATDRFATQNRFYGGTLGLRAGWTAGPVTLSVAGKVSLGTVHESVVRSGTTTLAAGPSPLAATVPGGLYNLGSNIGRQTEDEFAAVPEVNLRVGVRLTRCVSVAGGYNYLYVSRVARPGDQIGQTVNPTLIPTSPTLGVPFGPRQPAGGVTQTDFWAHGANVGLTFAY